MREIIELQGIRKDYQMGSETVHALDGVDVAIHKGDFVAILGPSGSGKSTLMHILGFMDNPTAGKMIFEGDDVSRTTGNQRCWYRSNRIGFVFQAFNLLPRLSVKGNVLLPVTYSRKKVGNKTEKALTALSRVGMEHRLDHIPNQLSGGERQRVAIARALINDPSLILADEPTGNLDSANRDRIMGLFTELQKEGQTIVMVTHDVQIADYAGRILRMNDGKIIEDRRK